MQRRQSGFKSGGRGSGLKNLWVMDPVTRNFQFHLNKFSIFQDKFAIFQAKRSDDLFLVVDSKNCLLSPKIQIFTIYTYILRQFFSFLENGLFPKKRKIGEECRCKW